MTKRIVWADALKGILILLVVLGHSIQAAMRQLGESCLNDYLWNLIYSFHMPAFMAVSGYLALRKNLVGGGRINWWEFVWRRFRQLVIPFLLWSIALFFVNHNVEHIYEYILYPQKSLWFLWALFFIAIVFDGVERIAVKLKIRQELIIVLCWLLLVGLMFVMPDAKLLGIEYVAYYFLYYAMGYCIHKYKGFLVIKKGVLIAIVGLLWFALGSIYSTQGLPSQLNIVPYIPTSITYYVYRIITACLAIFFLFSIGMKAMNEDTGRLKFAVNLGKVSLGIYAVHMIIRFRLVEGICFVFPDISYWPLMLLTFALLVPVSYVIVWLFGRWSVTSTWLLGKL